MFKILGINDDVTTCECCGKSNLKRTVILEHEDGGMVHYGSDCAAKAIHGTKKSSNVSAVNTLANAIQLARKWFAAGHDTQVIAKGIWNRFGYCCEGRDGNILIIGRERWTL